MDWSFIDKVVYINLERCPERNEKMKDVLKPFGDKVIRFNAIDVPEKGHYGCTSSHIAVLEMAIQNLWSNVLIVEDDIEWNHNDISYTNLQAILKNPWNVILFGGCFVNVDLTNFKISQACSTASYLVNIQYYHKLLRNFKLGQKFLKNNYCNSFFIDTIWRDLMKIDNWYIVFPNIFYQRTSISVIENKEINRELYFFTNKNIFTLPVQKVETESTDITNTFNLLKIGYHKADGNLLIRVNAETQVKIQWGNYFLIINENISNMEIERS